LYKDYVIFNRITNLHTIQGFLMFLESWNKHFGSNRKPVLLILHSSTYKELKLLGMVAHDCQSSSLEGRGLENDGLRSVWASVIPA
jgi:hypothetical protein